jgi:uncharacterized protein (DUF169 family)
MKKYDVERLDKALGLKRKIVGVRFLYFKTEYESLEIEEYGKKTSYCMMIQKAMAGGHFKAFSENFACRCALEALGLDKEMECVESGERYYSIKLYESRAVAKAVTKDISRIRQRIYGIESGPLEEMEEADVALFMVNAYQLMRVVEGYSYKYGIPKHLCMAGNQGVCADLTASPFEKNDLNFSVLCAGTRKMCSWQDDEMGVGIPIQQLSPLTEGIIETLNYIEYPERKKAIRQRIQRPDELGVLIDDELHYGKEGKAYVNPQRYEQLRVGETE